MKHHKLLASISAVTVVTLASCDREPVSLSDSHQAGLSAAAVAPPLHATVQFGIDSHGSPFPPPDEHDASGHARDKVYPREVVIARGGDVTFQLALVHQVAVYEPGTRPADIRIDATTLEDVNLGPFTIPNFRINDPSHRIVLGTPQVLFETEWTTPPGTFDQAGRYLVICTTLPHFASSNMYGWVTVK